MTTNYANDTNYLAIRISVIREIRSHRKFQVQCSNINVSSSYHKVQNSKFKGKRASLASQKGVNSHGINALLNL